MEGNASLSSTTSTSLITMEGNASLSSTTSTGNGDCQLVAIDEVLQHNFPFIEREWTNEEIDILKDGLKRYKSEIKSINRYVKIAAMLPNKTVRDVALKYQQMMQNESRKRGNKGLRRNNRMENIRNSSARPTSGRNTIMPVATNNVGQQLPQAIDNLRRQLLERNKLLGENTQALHQISANISSNKTAENIHLFAHVRGNILSLLNGTLHFERQLAVTKMPPFPKGLLDLVEDAVGKTQEMQHSLPF